MAGTGSANTPLYEEFDFHKAGEESIDIAPAVGGVVFYESIFSPVLTMTLTITDSGKNSNMPGNDAGDPFYTSLKPTGAESVSFVISNAARQRISVPVNKFKLNQIANAEVNNSIQAYTMRFYTGDFYDNNQLHVDRVYKNQTYNNIVGSIVSDVLQSEEEYYSDSTPSQVAAYYGSRRKPFTVIFDLASKSEFEDLSGAGFVFYRTRRGYHFKSLKVLQEQNHVAHYVKTDTLPTVYDEGGTSVDFTILSMTILRNADVEQGTLFGTYNAENKAINPYLSSLERSNGVWELDPAATPTLGLDEFEINEDIQNILGEGRQYTSLSNVGPGLKFDSKALSEVTNSTYNWAAQSTFAYNEAFNQIINITVPSNLDLYAGDVILVDIPKTGCQTELDQTLSGKYLIMDLCHFFTANRAFTSLRIGRGTYGRQESN